MDSEHLFSDPITRIESIFHPTTDDGFVLEERQDAEDIVDANRYLYNQFDERSNWKGDFHRVASIPMTVWMDLWKRGIAQDEAALKRWLDAPEQQYFRTRPGRLS